MQRSFRFVLILTTFVLTLLLTGSPRASAQYATLGPNGGVVLLNSPGIALPAAPAPPKAGISLADRTGISNNSADTTEVATIGSGGAPYNGSAVGNGTAPYNGAALGAANVPDGNNSNQTGAPISKARRDWGNSVFVGEGPVGGTAKPAAGSPTLAEVATRLKTSQKKARRTYTNADAQRINDNLQMKKLNQSPSK